MRLLREQKYTLQYIGDKFGLTRERVRQIIGNTGYIRLQPFYRLEELKAVQEYYLCTKKDVYKLYGLTLGEGYKRFEKSTRLIRDLRLKEGLVLCYGCHKLLTKSHFYHKKNLKINGIRCKKCTKKYVLKYAKEYRKRRFELDPEGESQKQRARSKISYAIKKGKLKKGECALKNKYCHGRIEANHWHGYDEKHALDVQWLCNFHHREVDKVGFKFIKH